MSNQIYSRYAILLELSAREFRKKLSLFPEELRAYVMLASSIIGAENAKRVPGTPEAVAKDGVEFSEKLGSMLEPGGDATFRSVLETYLIETIKDELRSCCPNCVHFERCTDMANLSVGSLFKRRVGGDNSESLKKEIAAAVDKALRNTPHLDSRDAHIECRDFAHQYRVSQLGEVFLRYGEIAAALQKAWGLDYRKVQSAMVSLNMEFCRTNGEQ